MDPEFGLIHVSIQTWLPLQLQVYLNGHEWLARKLARHGIRFTKQDNVFLWLEDFRRAQSFADRFVSLDWVARLNRYARSVNPLLKDLLPPMGYYWVTTQAEYSTDIDFKSRMKQNWLKLYDKAGLIIRVETVINAPEEFRVRRRVRRQGRQATLWVPLRKSVVYIFRWASTGRSCREGYGSSE